MKIIKPHWITHQGTPIYSVDLHPDGIRILTGGGDSLVKIWNMKAVDDPNNEKIPKLLSSLEGHFGSVNVVRWSANGRYFASGSDDKLVLVWNLVLSGGSNTIFGSTEKSYEQWRSTIQLRGHDMDITDLAWSPDGTKLATASFDNTVIVWDVAKQDKITVLKGHTSWVKGVAWDPIGKFVASHGSDKKVCVWRTSDWKLEKTVEDPIKTTQTHFSRPSFSPEGTFIALTNGQNGGHPTALLVDRMNWSVKVDFVGHQQPIVCTKFNGKIFRKGDSSPYCVCAIGSKEGMVSFWSTSSPRSLAVIKELFKSSVTDLSWSKDGYRLAATSLDNTVAFVTFQEPEIGSCLSDKEFQAAITEIHGDIHANQSIPESTYHLEMERQQKQQQALLLLQQAQQQIPTAFGVAVVAAAPSGPVKQTVTKLANGKRRITPQFVANNPMMPAMDAPMPLASPPIVPLLFPPTSTVPIAAPVPVTSPAPVRHTSTILNAPGTNKPSTTGGSAPNVASGSASTSSSTSTSTATSTASPVSAFSTPAYAAASPPSAANSGEKRKTEFIDPAAKKQKTTEESSKEKPKEKKAKEKPRDKTKEKSINGLPEKSPAPTKESTAPSIPLLSLPAALPKILWSSSDVSNPLDVEASIADLSNGEAITTLSCRQRDKILWEDRVRSRVTLIAVSLGRFIVAGCSDGSLYLYSLNGRHTLPCIVLGESIVALEANKNGTLLAITSSGSFSVWDLPKLALLYKSTMTAIIQPDRDLRRARVTESGSIVVTLSNYQSYSYHPSMETWMRVADDKFSNSEFNSINIFQTEQRGLLAELQVTATQNSRPSALFNFGLSSQAKATESVSHLENQIASALLLGSVREYEYWFKTYVRRLSDDSSELKLREVFESLLGPPHKLGTEAMRKSSWDPLVLGIPKRTLLNDVLPLIGLNRNLQRLVSQYRELLSSLM